MGEHDFSTAVGSQIKNLVQTLNKKNYRANVSEIEKIVQTYGYEAYRFLLRLLLKEINFHNITQKDHLKLQLLTQEFAQLTTKTNFVSFIVEIFEGIPTSGEFLTQFSRTLSLPLSQQMLIGLALAQSNDPNTRQDGISYLKSKLQEVLETGPTALPENIIKHFLYFVSLTPEFSKEKEKILKAFEVHQQSHITMTPFFSSKDDVVDSKRNFTETKEKDVGVSISISSIMKDLGYSCLATQEAFLEVLAHFNNITEEDVAKIIGMMINSYSGLEENISVLNTFSPIIGQIANNKETKPKTWNMDVFISVIKKKYPKIDWHLVVKKLDYTDFILNDQKGFVMLTTIIRKATEFKSFPVDCILGFLWNNRSGQLSIITHALDAPPDVVNFGSAPRRVTLNQEFPKELNNPTWSSLDLIETLLNLAEGDNYKKVRKLFEYPIKHCPELLVVGLAEARPLMPTLQKELLDILMPTFIRAHKHSTAVLNQVVNVNKELLVNTLVETYLKDRSTQVIRRILTLATTIQPKIIKELLNVRPFSFTILFATLAAQRDHTNLEHWLMNNMKEYGNLFVQECINFFFERFLNVKDPEKSSLNLPDNIQATFVKCLNIYKMNVPNVPHEIVIQIDEILNHVNEKIRHEATTGEFRLSLEVEKLASQHFEEIFRREKSIEDAIKLLKHLKSSSKQQDQELFACMIHNLFDEYRFFQNYPQQELQIVAQFFGAIINEKIIFAKTLRYALLYVLQALSNPGSEKMFQFGIIALSQFKSRLKEFPQFCSHLKQLPHVTQVMPELIPIINKALEGVEESKLLPQSPMHGSVQSVQFAKGVRNVNLQGMQQPQVLSAAPEGIMPSDIPKTSEPIPPGTPPRFPSTPPPTSITQQTPTTPVMHLPDEKLDTPTTPTVDRGGFGFPMDISTLRQHEKKLDIPLPDEKIMDKMSFIINNLSPQNVNDKIQAMKEILKPEHYPYLANYIVVNRASMEPNFHQLYLKFLDGLGQKALFDQVLKMTYVNIYNLLESEKITESISERSLLKNLGSWLGLLTIAKNKPILKKDLDLKELLLEAYEKGRLIAVMPFVAKVLENCTQSKVIKPPNPWVMGTLSVLAEIHRQPNLKSNLKFEVEVLCKKLKVKPGDIEIKNLLADKKVVKEDNPDWLQSKKKVSAELKTEERKEPRAELKGRIEIPDIPIVIAGLKSLVKINEQIPLFIEYPQLKALVPVALDRAIRDIIAPVVKRAVAIACRTTAELVTKDFAMEPDENKMRHAATLMVQHLAGNLAMVTCKDPLRVTIETRLATLLQSIFVEPDNTLKAKMEHAIKTISVENLELGCAYIEKAACDKAVIEINEALAQEYNARRKHQLAHMPWTGFMQTRNLPEALLSKMGVHQYQMRVYEDFAKQHPFQQPAEDQQVPVKPTPQDPTQLLSKQALDKVMRCIEEIENEAKNLNPATTLRSLSPEHPIITRLVVIPSLIQSSSFIEGIANQVIQKALKKLYESEAKLMIEIYLVILEGTRDAYPIIIKNITQWWIELDSEKKFDKDITLGAIRSSLLFLPEVDNYLVSVIKDRKAVTFCVQLVKHCIVEEHYLDKNDIPKTFDFLLKNAKKLEKDFPGITKLMEKAKSVKKETRSDIAGLQDRIIMYFKEWLNVIVQPQFELRLQYLNQLNQSGLISTEADFENFVRIIMEACTESFKQTPKSIIIKGIEERTPPEILFKHIDAFSDLFSLILKSQEPKIRLLLLTKGLSTVAKLLKRDHDMNNKEFNQRPYFRFLSNLLMDFNVEDPSKDPTYFSILTAFSNLFYSLQPRNIPGFSFAWLELISHRMFMPKLLFIKNYKGWPHFHNLLIALFKFLEPYLRNAELNDAIRLLYRGTLKILLVLLHDFSEFLCDYHFSLCDAIPPSCIQMRNLILSAFPRHMRLPDPFTPNLKVDLLPEINQSPKILSKYTAAIEKAKLKDKIDQYLKNRRPTSFLQELKSKLLLPTQEIPAAGTRYNVPLINSLVLYVGIQAINQLKSGQQTRYPFVNSAAMDIYQKLILELDSEGRYLFLNAIANQLRYPNNHTHYFSCALLYLFAEMRLENDPEIIQEQITRVLLERLIVNRPHPWGLLITFIELVKNPRYNFWEKNFIHCAAEIERLFENVGRSCISAQQPPKTDA